MSSILNSLASRRPLKLVNPRRSQHLKVQSSSGIPRIKPTGKEAQTPKINDTPPKSIEDKPPAVSLNKPLKTPPTKEATQTKSFRNTNRFVVPADLRAQFNKIWEVRKSLMESSPGFKELKIADGSVLRDGEKEVVVSSEWSSIPEWEAYSCDKAVRRSHFPPVLTPPTAFLVIFVQGIFQYVPKRGEGFPEDFTPFFDYQEAVNAKYSK